MLDDASDQGLREALRLLPVSSKGSGLLVTSHLIKKPESNPDRKPEVFSNLLTSRADGAAAVVALLQCDRLSDATAEELFHSCGFLLQPANAAIGDAVASELKVRRPHLNKNTTFSLACAGHEPPSCCSATVCRVEQPTHDQSRREV